MNENFKKVITCVLVIGFMSALVIPAVADENGFATLRKTSKAFSTVAKKATPAVVSVQVEKTIQSGRRQSPHGIPFDNNSDLFERFFGPQYRQQVPQQRKQMGQGSGFIISEDGYIISNNHVVGSADKIKVTMNDGSEYDAKLIGSDPGSDVAVIKIDATNLPMIELGNSKKLEVGEWVIAVGNPFGLNATVTVGIVSAKGRSDLRLVGGGAGYEDFIQTDAAINPGNSGGPLLDIDGKAIGLNTAIYSQSGGYMGIGFAIPIDMVKAIKDQLIESGKVVRGYVGVRGDQIDPRLAKAMDIENSKAIQIIEVVENSPADKSGLKAGDIILSMNREDIEGWSEFRNNVSLMSPGTKIELVVLRDTKQKKITVTVGSFEDAEILMGKSKAGEKIGIEVQELTDELAKQYGYENIEGVVVSDVKSDSEASRAGIKKGSLIISVDRKRIESVKDFNKAMEKAMEDKEVLLQVTDGSSVWWYVLSVD